MKRYNNHQYVCNRSVIINENSYDEHVNNNIGFYCPHCYTPIIINVNFTININSSLFMTHDSIYTIKCPKCNYINRFEYYLDPNITYAIALLNCKGYETVFSCEGNNDSEPYIMFNHAYEGILNVKPRKPWYIDFKSSHVVLSDKGDDESLVIRCNKDTLLFNRINSLNKWAEELPYNEYDVVKDLDKWIKESHD